MLHKGSDYVRMMVVVLFLRPASTCAFAGRLMYHGVVLYLAELGGSLAKYLYALVTCSLSVSNVR
jgi:hypothetical protein